MLDFEIFYNGRKVGEIAASNDKEAIDLWAWEAEYTYPMDNLYACLKW